ncbi:MULTISPECIES: acyl-CoA dehydrogenase [unclassified Pseudonocardia]|uniref:acyl-CoA dehydrogenase n=1 Tax=unclassified Pseudonocardia TaxID=2619320 RepID=UPI0001FFE3A9|nr:acyl-CoA dehydrogenase [Pseudonocardia sp. Ae707_Ps1]OLM18247.1 3-methylmercaptopropionyl-CoA dehydrogenase (DmdC) [Pseudonocardia sp. Ae707_Ps1]
MPHARDLILSRQDLHFLLHDWLDVEALTTRPRFADHSRETVDAVLDLAAEIATEKFAPHNRRNDVEEPVFVGTDGVGRVELHDEVAPALRAAAEAGLLSATMDEAAGGLQLPHVVGVAVQAWFHAANVGTWAYAMLSVANANLLLALADPALVERYVPPMLEGRMHGTMCLSEPQAGSSLADITTRAEPAPDGTYRVTGTKMWISGGDHELGENIVHLVLAKVPGGPAGVRGISLFLVPKILPDGRRNDVALAGVNHKMGYRGTVNTLLAFGESGGAVGHLVGAEGQGLAAMFLMMNEARVGVGAGAAALACTGYLKSLDYARSRPQGRPAGEKDPSSPMVPIVRHADVRRMLLAQKSYAEGALALVLYCGRLVDEERTGPDPEEAHLLLETLTPIAKSWPSQWGLEANALAIQVQGGYGYSREYDVEQHYRDNRLNAIHEGTHGIQAADLLGRKVVMAGGAGFVALRNRIADTIGRAGADPATSAMSEQLQGALDRLVEVTATLHAHPDAEERLANASVYLEAAGHVVVAWLWLDQVLAAAGRDDDLARGKRAAARYFFRFELPRVVPQLDLLASLDRTTLDTDPAWL